MVISLLFPGFVFFDCVSVCISKHVHPIYIVRNLSYKKNLKSNQRITVVQGVLIAPFISCIYIQTIYIKATIMVIIRYVKHQYRL